MAFRSVDATVPGGPIYRLQLASTCSRESRSQVRPVAYLIWVSIGPTKMVGPVRLTRLVGRVQFTLHQWTPPTTQMCKQVPELCQSNNQSERTISAQRSWLQTSPAPPTPRHVSGQSCCFLDAMGLFCGVSGFAWLVVSFLGSQVTGSCLCSHRGLLKAIYDFGIKPSLAENYLEVASLSQPKFERG